MNLRPAELLLVEDEPGDVRLVEDALKNSKILNNLHVVVDGAEALAFLRREGRYANAVRPDIIFLDLNMPKKSGHEVLSEVKNDPNLRRIPIVVMTSSEAEEDIVKSYDQHANCYVKKPLSFEQFEKVVMNLNEFWFSIVTLPEKE